MLTAEVIAKAAGKPVQLIWSREEDIRQDHYRAAMGGRYKGALDADGKLTALQANVVGPSLIDDFNLPPKLDTVIHVMAVSGDAYTIPNQKLSYARPWLAWVPIANIIVTLQLAKKPWWWLLILGLGLGVAAASRPTGRSICTRRRPTTTSIG